MHTATKARPPRTAREQETTPRTGQDQDQDTAQRRPTRRTSPSILKLAAHNTLSLWWFAPLSLAGGLLTVFVANPAITSTYDDPASARKFFFLAATVLIANIGNFFQIKKALLSRPLLVAGLSRRSILKLNSWQSFLYALAAAGLTLLVVLGLAVTSGDFSGRLLLDDAATVNLWAVPALVAVGSYCAGRLCFWATTFGEPDRWPGVLFNVLIGASAYICIVAVIFGIRDFDQWVQSLFGTSFDGSLFSWVSFWLSFVFPVTALFEDDTFRPLAANVIFTALVILPASWLRVKTMVPRKVPAGLG